MNGILLDGEALSRSAKSMSAIIDYERALRASLMICNSLRKRSKQDVQSSKAPW
jgi:hypothetical protein